MIRHMWDTMRVWIRLLSFMELKVEDELDADFSWKTWRGCKDFRWDGLNILVQDREKRLCLCE